MPAFTTRLGDGWRRARRSLPLALVPLLFALTDVEKLRAVTAFDGVHVGFRLGLPASVVTLWQFVSVPQSGVNVDPGVPLSALPLVPVSVPVFLVVQAFLTAGYFGSVAERLRTGEYRFVHHATAHFFSFLVLTALPVVVFLPLALGLVGPGAVTGERAVSVPFVVLGFISVVVVSYLFYATPYLLVLRGSGLVDAARGSYALAVAGGPYLSYSGGVALFVLAVSPVASAVVVSAPTLGLPAGLSVGSVLGLAVNVATMRFVADLDPESPAVGDWGDDGTDTRGPPDAETSGSEQHAEHVAGDERRARGADEASPVTTS